MPQAFLSLARRDAGTCQPPAQDAPGRQSGAVRVRTRVARSARTAESRAALACASDVSRRGSDSQWRQVSMVSRVSISFCVWGRRPPAA